MEFLFWAGLSLCIIIPILVLIYSTIAWLTHIRTTKLRHSKYGWASYKTFKREFQKVKWVNEHYNTAMNGSSFRSSMGGHRIIFDDKPMIIRTPIGYLKALLLFYRTYRNNRNTIKWD